MKAQQRMDNIVGSKLYPLLLFAVSFVFVALFSRSTSFLYVFEGGDPAIFKQMGLAMLRGKTLYIDYFDNKGCILYFIQALGLWLGGDFFILLMQVVSLTITLLIWDKMLSLYRGARGRLVGLGIALVLLLCFYQDGDLTEEWCLPFASYPIWVYFRSLKSGKGIRNAEMLGIGLCFGIIAFIRINNAAPFLGFVAYVWLKMLGNKDFKNLLMGVLCFVSGLFAVAAASMLYFYLKAGWHGVYEMLYGTFLSNFEYMQIEVEQKIIIYVVYALFVLLCITQQAISSAKDRDVLVPAMLSYGLFVVSTGTRCFTHYLMALLPLMVVLLMTLQPVFRSKRNLASVLLFLIAACAYLPIPIALMFNDLVLKNDKYSVIYADFHKCIQTIPEADRDSIFNYNLLGMGAAMMQHEGLLQCNRIFFSTFGFKMPTLHKEEMEKPLVKPKWMLVAWENYYTDKDAFFILENYDEAYSFEHDRVYLEKPQIGLYQIVYLYRRKD